MKLDLTPTRRRYLYRLGYAVIAVLIGFGVITDQHGLILTGLLAPLLGLADANVPSE